MNRLQKRWHLDRTNRKSFTYSPFTKEQLIQYLTEIYEARAARNS